MVKFVRHHSLRYSAYVVAAMLTAGCGDTSHDQASTGGNAEAPEPINEPAPQEPTKNGRQLELRGVDYDGLLEFIASHTGHPIVLDIWSTSCPPCIKELPNLAKLQEDYVGRGIVCATFNIDFTGAEGTTPEEARERAREVLVALDLRVHNLYSTVPDSELYRTPLFKENRVYAIPAILVFDGEGNVVDRYGDVAEGASPYSEVRRQVESLLKED